MHRTSLGTDAAWTPGRGRVRTDHFRTPYTTVGLLKTPWLNGLIGGDKRPSRAVRQTPSAEVLKTSARSAAITSSTESPKHKPKNSGGRFAWS